MPMSIVSNNIRGCGSLEKRRRLNQLISNENFNFHFLQKTKLENLNSEDVNSLWDG